MSIDCLYCDAREAVRRLLREPAFAVLASLTLALGIGANATVFSVVRSVLLRPLPYGDPDAIVVIWQGSAKGSTTWLSLQEVLSYGREATTVQRVGAYSQGDANLTGDGEPDRVPLAAVTWDLFDTLEVPPLFGRSFTEGESDGTSRDVVILSHGLWVRRFGSSAGVLGRDIHVNGRARTVVGVMPPGFRLPLDYRSDLATDLFVPLEIDRADPGPWGSRNLIGIARLGPGVRPAAATGELQAIAAGWIRAGYVPDQRDARFDRAAVRVQQLVTGEVRTPLFLLLGTVAFVLLIAVANVVNLLLARGDLRGRDLAIRAALGAARGRLVSLVLMESLLLAIGGGSLGIVLAWVGVRALTTVHPASLPRAGDIGLDAGVVIFTAAVTLGSGLLVAIVPALRFLRGDLARVLRDEGSRGTPGRHRQILRRALVAGQVALAVTLVAGATLLVRSFVTLVRIDPGYEPSGVLTARVQLPATEYETPAQVVRFYRRLVDRVAEVPGVEAAGAVRILPLTRTIGDWSITLDSRPYSPAENPNADLQVATPGYFEAMGIRPVRGRLLTPGDDEEAPLVAVVSETMAARYWPGEEAIGRRFHLGTADQPWVTIVGTIGTVRHNAIVEEPRAEMYLPHAQLPREVGWTTSGMTVAIRTSGAPLGLVEHVRAGVRELDGRVPISHVRTMEEVVAAARAEPRFTTTLLTVFGFLALALAAIGLHGTISLLVTERTHEIGIRTALGASRLAIVRLIVGEGLLLAAAGGAVGVAGAAAVAALSRSLLFGVTAHDPVTFLLVPAILLAVALAATMAPAHRAARLDPVATLRR